METFDKIRQGRGGIFYTIITVLLLCSVIIGMIAFIFDFAEQEAFEMLHIETEQIKNDINLQMVSDRENLVTMANFAAELYAKGQDYDLLFESFEEIGLIKHIGILTKDNVFTTKAGVYPAEMSFEEEVKKGKENNGKYISGRVKDATHPDTEVVRNAVPVISGGETIAILYGLVELDHLMQRYVENEMLYDGELIVFERENGDFLVDTKNKSLGNITMLANAKFKDGFSYDDLMIDLENDTSSMSVDEHGHFHGYTAFMSQLSSEYYYAHYTYAGIGDWYILMAKPESVVFRGARATGAYLLVMLLIIMVILAAYVVFIFSSERRKHRINTYSSNIRKRLLELNTQMDRISEVLKLVTVFAKSRSAFFVDTLGEDYNFIMPSQEKRMLLGESKKYFLSKLLNYASRQRTEHGAEVFTLRLDAKPWVDEEIPGFYDFMKAHHINRVSIAVIGNNNSTSVLGVINPNNKYIDTLFKEISVCVSMAVYNKKHLDKTESMALTDSLTGIKNRMAYKQDIKVLESLISDKLACIYIDVNELHYFNNKYGHAAGDQMLVFVADVLDKEFADGYLYRMGGDEFLVFADGYEYDELKKKMSSANSKIEEMKYHIAYGISFGDANISIEGMLVCAEKNMYENKAIYYQHKEESNNLNNENPCIECIATGIKELDATLSVMGLKYFGIYSASLENDAARPILVPSYMSHFTENEAFFSKALAHYISEMVLPEYQRAVSGFVNYSVIKKQLADGFVPSITYKKNNGETVILNVYPVPNADDGCSSDTIWVFEKAKG